jgi:hypothetical protein
MRIVISAHNVKLHLYSRLLLTPSAPLLDIMSNKWKKKSPKVLSDILGDSDKYLWYKPDYIHIDMFLTRFMNFKSTGLCAAGAQNN